MTIVTEALAAIDRMVCKRKIDRIVIDPEQEDEIMLVDQYRVLHISPQLWDSMVFYCTRLMTPVEVPKDTPQIAALFGIPVTNG